MPEPDLIVVSPEAVGARSIEKPPVVVVEVLSPTGKDRDLFEKRRIYGQAGALWYWLVDPAGPAWRSCAWSRDATRMQRGSRWFSVHHGGPVPRHCCAQPTLGLRRTRPPTRRRRAAAELRRR